MLLKIKIFFSICRKNGKTRTSLSKQHNKMLKIRSEMLKILKNDQTRENFREFSETRESRRLSGFRKFSKNFPFPGKLKIREKRKPWYQRTEICQTDGFCCLWPETDPGGRMRDPPASFKHVFDVYNFSIISNIFDSDKPYALSTYNRKCANKMHHIWRSTQIRVKKLNKICVKIIQNALK